MTRRDNPLTVYLSDSELAQLKKWADETDKPLSQLGREAIMEYTDHDRVARVEEQVRELDGKIDDVLATLSDANSHTHKAGTGMNAGTTAVEKAREIVRKLQANHDGVIKDDDVVLAIEDIAGADGRTVKKYKRLFRKRGLVFEHPGDRPIWTLDSDMWVDWMTDYVRMNGTERAEKVTNQYPARITETLDGKPAIQLEVDERYRYR